jgi:excinuclease ABC subunit C
LEGLPGIGPKTASLLWKRFGSLEGMAQASLEDLQSLPGIGPGRAAKMLSAFKSLE